MGVGGGMEAGVGVGAFVDDPLLARGIGRGPAPARGGALSDQAAFPSLTPPKPAEAAAPAPAAAPPAPESA